MRKSKNFVIGICSWKLKVCKCDEFSAEDSELNASKFMQLICKDSRQFKKCKLTMKPLQKCIIVVLLSGIFILVFLDLRNDELEEQMKSRLLLKQDVKNAASDTDSIFNLTQLIHLEPMIDRKPKFAGSSLIQEIEDRLPSLPIRYWDNHKTVSMYYKNNSCAKFPSIYELQFNNLYWQTLRSSSGTFYLYGAYFDVRKLSPIGPAVRILGMLDRIEPRIMTTHCQFWFENETEPVISKVTGYQLIYGYQKADVIQTDLHPYLITCQIPASHTKRVPASVSLVKNICDTATNNLKVFYNHPPKKKGFCVCVKGLDFIDEDVSVRLVEWIELIGILGADKIFFYELQAHPNITKVLNYYRSIDKVDVAPFTLPGDQPNVPLLQHLYISRGKSFKLKNEFIQYNDCFYKNLYTYEHIVLLDVDEVIMPSKRRTWKELMNDVMVKLRNESKASYSVRGIHFLDDSMNSHEMAGDIPKYMHMLQHVYRSKKFTKFEYRKCFHNPEKALTVFNHQPSVCFGKCSQYKIATEEVLLQHYRAECQLWISEQMCKSLKVGTVADTAIWRYKEELITKTVEVLRVLGFFSVVT